MRLQLKLNRKSVIVWMIIISLMIFGFMAFYPTMADENLQILMEGMSDSILQILGFDSFPDFSQIDQFYGYIIQYVSMALLVYASILGLSTFLKEEREGTIEFLYAQPATRTQLVLTKLMAHSIILADLLLVIISTSILSFIIFTPKDVGAMSIIIKTIPVFGMMTLNAFIFLLFATGLSLILKSTISPTAVAMAMVFGPYLIGMMAQMIDVLKPIECLSILHTSMPDRIYAGKFDFISLSIWLVVSISIFLCGLHRFQKRDMKS